MRRAVFSAFDWFVSRVEIPFQVVRSGFSRVFATFIHSEHYSVQGTEKRDILELAVASEGFFATFEVSLSIVYTQIQTF